MEPATLPDNSMVKNGKRIFQFIDEKILLAGTAGLDNKEDLKRTRLVNSICAITAFLALSIGFLFYLLTGLLKEIFIPAAIEASLFSLIIFLNVWKLRRLASFSCLIVHLGCAVYFASLLGSRINVVIILAFLFGLCRLIYKDKLQRGVSMTAIALALIVIEANAYLGIIKPLDMPERSQWIFRWIALPSFLFFFVMILDYYDIEIKRLYKQIKDFVRDVVHDLRNVTVSNSQTLIELKSELNKKVPDLGRIRLLVNKVSSANENMSVIINNILDKAGNKITINVFDETFSLIDLIKNVIETLSASADSRSLEIVNWYDAEMPEYVVSDLGRMNTILINFLSNAIKYSDKETKIKLAVSKDMDHFTISVTNSCPRIPEEKLARLFDEHYTAKRDENVVGNGIGLHIVKRTVEAFNGTYGVTSNDTETTFYVRLRLVPGKKVDISEIIGEPQTLDGAEIYYAEDNLMDNMITKRYLKNAGCNVTTCVNGKEMLELLHTDPKVPDCFVLDDRMPVMNGNELLKKLKSPNSPYKNIPVIILTGDGFTENIDQLIAAGADQVIIKSNQQFLEIKNALDRHLHRRPAVNAG
ncbi:ATP-binding response regulator [Chitinophaga niabensis]|uniref:histidine kinase n=1 Tax=Chitinophaga niabensis TaxID=536979 RepID=A0A1N6E2C0_9BACT|nr:hybrid sensor histidine kinase/response regulator [Chitinophaga niabensis]SIN77117.1 Signal transduction histidine kinase [Chitinophaga niabensis]